MKLNDNLSIWLLIILLPLLSGCEKAPINSYIEGMWKLEEFVTHEDHISHPCERIYYSIQLQVVDIAEKQGKYDYKPSVGRFIYGENGTLIMKDFHYRAMTTDNKQATKLEDLRPYGINNLETTFKIIKANGKDLVLRSDYATLTFTSF